MTFERANVVHMGDLTFNRPHPFVDRPAGARIGSWIEMLERVPAEHAADTIYVFWHGSPNASMTGNRSELAQLRDYFSAALELTRREMQMGKSKEEITETASSPGFDDYVSPLIPI